MGTCTFLKVKQSYTVSFHHKSLAHTPKLVKRQGIEHVRINKGHLLSSLCTDPPLSSVKIGAGASSPIFSEGRWGGGGGVCTQAIIIFSHVREPEFWLNPKSGEILQGFVIRNTAQGIQNLSSTDWRDWNPAPGMRNPRRGIPNSGLCWNSLMGRDLHIYMII